MSVLSASIGGTRRLVIGIGQYGLLLGPIRRAVVEPAAAVSDEVLRLLLCHYGKRLWEVGLIAGSCGNLSARSRARQSVYVTPRSANKSRLIVSDIRRVPLDPAPSDLTEISVEFPMHRASYLADPAVGAVIHTHAPALTAVGIRRLDLAEFLPEVEASVGSVRWLPFAPSGSQALADRVGDAVAQGARLLLLERHGAVSVGRELAEAYDRMELGELSARTALLAGGDPACESF